jgi:hypothetical protein
MGFEAELNERFAVLGGPPDDSNWDDVAKRARALRSGGRRSRLRRTVAVAAPAAAMVVLVTPAAGVRDALRGLFTGESAPPRIEKLFTDLDSGAPAHLATGVIPDDVHKLITLELSTGREAVLWVAPTKAEGGWCAYLERVGSKHAGGPTCNAPVPSTRPITGANIAGTGEQEIGPRLMFGAVRDDVASLSLEFTDGSVRELKLVKNFFLIELPARDVRPYVLRARDSAGSELMNMALPFAWSLYPETRADISKRASR